MKEVFAIATSKSLCEKVSVIDHYTQQLLNSGYSKHQIREIIESSLKGILRKEERKRNSKARYRSNVDTLEIRVRKKLIESTTWYRDKEESDVESFDENSEKRWTGRESSCKEWRKSRGG